MLLHTRAPALGGAVLTLLLLAGCRDHAHPPAAAGEPEPIVLSHTVYTSVAEHFDEHPPLVAGKPVKFAAHATDVRGDFVPVEQGTMVVVAVRGGKVIAESAPVKPSRRGIFGPVITVPAPGPVEIRILLRAGDLQDEASLGEVAVHASEAEAAMAHAGPETTGPGPISFLKEQQWRLAFRNEPAAKHSLVETVRIPARVVPRPGGRAIVAAPASGIVMARADGGFPTLGDAAARGDLLGSIAPVLAGAEGTQLLAARASLEAGSIAAEAELVKARARQERAERQRSRAERLREGGAASERELEDARFEAELAQADVAAATRLLEPYAAVRRAREGGAVPLSIPLESPIAGRVARAQALPGEYVEAGAVLFEIVELSTVWIQGDVPEPDLGRIPARPAAAWLPAAVPGAAPGVGTLEFVALAPIIDPDLRAARILYACPNPDGALRLGAVVDLEIETARAAEALAIPESAVVEEDGRPVVFVQIEGEAFERREVVLGLRSQGRIEVREGVAEGERVVTLGAYAVRLQSVSTTIPAHGHAH